MTATIKNKRAEHHAQLLAGLANDDDTWVGFDWLCAYFGGVSKMTVMRYAKTGIIPPASYPTGPTRPLWLKSAVKAHAVKSAERAAKERASTTGKAKIAERYDRQLKNVAKAHAAKAEANAAKAEAEKPAPKPKKAKKAPKPKPAKKPATPKPTRRADATALPPNPFEGIEG
jgi:hypothetical protein